MRKSLLSLLFLGLLLSHAWAVCPQGAPQYPDSIRLVLEHNWDNGFPAARAECVDSAHQPLWRIARGTAWVWAPAVQKGGGKTRPEVFASLAGLEAGEPVILRDIPRAERRLARLGYYEKQGEQSLYRIARRNRLVVGFPLRDVSSNRLEAALAYDGTGDGWNGNVDLELRNMLGTARDFSFHGENGPLRRAGSLYYKEPRLLGLRWDAKLRGALYEEDSLRERSIEAELVRRLGFEWEYILGGGLGSRDWRSSVGLAYDGRDRLPLPREGRAASALLRILGPRGDDTTEQRVQMEWQLERLWAFGPDWGMRFTGKGATMVPSRDYGGVYLFSIGGRDDFLALRPYSVRTRAYGIVETDWQWVGLKNSALHVFFQPGLYRQRLPQHGWARVYGYGFGWEQAGSAWSVSLYYSLTPDLAPNEGLLNMSVRTYF